MTLAPCSMFEGGVCTDPVMDAGEVDMIKCLKCPSYDPIWGDTPWEGADESTT